jgi:toxin ParE1/3/4
MTDKLRQYTVLLTDDAERDIDDIATYIAAHDSPAKAIHVLDQFAKVLASLANMPQRGAYPRELLDLGIKAYRQTHFKPYRVIYQVAEDQVHVLLIADDRRNMHALLARRLLAG